MDPASQRGILLIEVLLVVAFLAALVAIGTQVALVSMRSTTSSERRDVSTRLAQELLEGARLAAASDWYALAAAPHGTALISTTTTSSSWDILPGGETLRVGAHTYTRSFMVASTSRDPNTRDLEDVYDAAHDEPSAFKLTAYVVPDVGATTTLTEYVARWRNRVCVQTTWDTPGELSPTDDCTTGAFDEAEAFPSGSVSTADGGIMLAP